MTKLVEKVINIIDKIETGENTEEKLHNIVENEIRRKLMQYELINLKLSRKYGMTLEEFEGGNIVKKKKYSFEVENDYHDWDMAVDGINTLKIILRNLNKK